MSSCMHIDNKTKDILIIWKGQTQGLDDNTWTAEAQYAINLSRSIGNFVYACIIMWATAFYLLMLQKHISSKQKILKKRNILSI